jgi:hypothetical protein
LKIRPVDTPVGTPLSINTFYHFQWRHIVFKVLKDFFARKLTSHELHTTSDRIAAALNPYFPTDTYVGNLLGHTQQSISALLAAMNSV